MEPVARIVPANSNARVAGGAHAMLFARLESQPALNAGRWTRDELYEDEE